MEMEHVWNMFEHIVGTGLKLGAVDPQKNTRRVSLSVPPTLGTEGRNSEKSKDPKTIQTIQRANLGVFG